MFDDLYQDYQKKLHNAHVPKIPNEKNKSKNNFFELEIYKQKLLKKQMN
jgi:hypothetical protein